MKPEEIYQQILEACKADSFVDRKDKIIAILQKHVVGRAELYQTIEADLAFQEELGKQANMPDLLEKVRGDNRNFVEMALAQLRECARLYENPTLFLSVWLRATVVMVKVYEDLLKYKHVNEAKTQPLIINPNDHN